MTETGAFQLQGGLYVVDRGDEENPPDYLGGTRVGRLSELLRFRPGQNFHLGNKGDDAPSWARKTGDWVELEATFVDLTQEYLSLVTNKMSNNMNIKPRGAYKHGHLLRPENYSTIVIRDEESPLDYPALYIPYALCIDNGWFAASAGKHVEFAELLITSFDLDENIQPYEYGDISQFDRFGEE